MEVIIDKTQLLIDYKNNYTLEMISQKHECSKHLVLDIIYSHITGDKESGTNIK